MPHIARFEIDIVRALTDQLEEAVDALSESALTTANVASVLPEQGVYQLFHKNALVYIGRADDLRKRLGEHLEKVRGRLNITLNDMGFTALYVHRNWTTMAPEDVLIRHYQSRTPPLADWNGKSFGPHDPGRDRETTNKPTQGWDAMYPIREDWPCPTIAAGSWNGRELLMALKAALPYVLRYETSNPKRWRDGHPDYNSATITVPSSGMKADDILRLVAASLPGWQATAFPSHMILCKETAAYVHGHPL